MKTIKHLLLFAIVITGATWSPIVAAAHDNYYNSSQHDDAAPSPDQNTDMLSPDQTKPEAAKTLTVTSIQKCYSQLSRQDALDIQRNYIKPYQECRRRLELKLQKKPLTKDGGASDYPAEGPQRHFLQIQKTPERTGPASDSSDVAEPKKPPVFQDKTVPLN
ncbi:MAG: hypothetical protein HY052_02000 [Proteobacteria bacterium]|nr:hypothetical protein [Pseudomonadota bacterium]